MEQCWNLLYLHRSQVYDIRKECIGPLCYDFSRLDDYINQPHVREELGVGDREWEACNMEVNFDMQGGLSEELDQYVATSLVIV
jgi:serine carboxypeptidase-like clade 4